MKKDGIIDERVLNLKRQIGNEAFNILFYGLLACVLIQQIVFDAPFVQYSAEFTMLICVSIYVLIRNLLLGNDLFCSEKYSQKFVIIKSLVCGTSITVVNTILNFLNYKDLFLTNILNTIMISFITFIFGTITAFVVFQILYKINKKRQDQIKSKYEDEE